MSLDAVMIAHPSIQDLSSEAELISHDTSPLAIVGYRQQMNFALLAPAGRIGFSARWDSLFTEMQNFSRFMIELVEIATTRAIRRRVSILVAYLSYIYIISYFFIKIKFSFKERFWPRLTANPE